jgi:hypothetical protein
MPWKRAPSCATGPLLEGHDYELSVADNYRYSRRPREDSQRERLVAGGERLDLSDADQELLTAEYAENRRRERREEPNSLRTGAAEFFRFFPQALLP